MKNNLLRKIASIVLALSMVLSMVTMAFAGNSEDSAAAYTAEEAAAVLQGIKVVDSEDYNASAIITKEKAATIICRLMLGRAAADNLSIGETSYSDVAADSENIQGITYCVNLGILDAKKGSVKPSASLKVKDFGKMLMIAMGYDAKTEKFTGLFGSFKVKKALKANGLLDGVTSKSKLTEADAALMCLNALGCGYVSYVDGVKTESSQTIMTTVFPALQRSGSAWTYGNDVLYGTTDRTLVASFMVCSDLHIGASSNGPVSTYFENGIDAVKKAAGGKLDALVVAGDLTNYGTTIQIDMVRRIIEKKLDAEETPLIFCSGNHDFFNWYYDKTGSIARDFDSRAYSMFDSANYACDIVDAAETPANCRHAVINGVHIICVNVSNYSVKALNKGQNAYSDETIAWFKEQMAAAAADAPNMPIYVVTHMPISDSVNGSDYYSITYPDIIWDSDELEGILKQYSQAVLISGHTHYSPNGDDSIYQDGYTAINDGSIQYLVTDYGFQQNNNGESSIPEESDDHPSVMLFQTYSDGTTVMTRYDANTGEQVREPWVITTAAEEYTTARTGSVKPVFVVEDLSAESIAKGSARALEITFSAASSPYDIYYYTVQLYKDGKEVFTKKYSTDYYTHPDKADCDNVIVYNLGTVASDELQVTITAYDVLGNASESQTITVPPYEK